MKQDKKKLYESIMTSVAKEVKKALNESSYDEDDYDFDTWKDLLNRLDDINTRYDDNNNDTYEGIEKMFDLAWELEEKERGELTDCHTCKELAEYIRNMSKLLLLSADRIENFKEPININLIDLCEDINNEFDMNDWCEWIDLGDDSLITLLNSNGVMEFLEKKYNVNNEDLTSYIKDNIYKICDELHDYEPSERELESWGREHGYSSWSQDDD